MRLLTRPVARRSRDGVRGMTLIELMVAIAVIGVLLAAAGPYLGDYVINSRLREAGNLVFAEALIAQSEAVKRNTVVQLATNGSSVQVLDMTVPTAPVLLRERTLQGNVNAPAASVNFGSEGRPTPLGATLSVDFSIPGLTCSTELRCPGLRVDAGGAVRLCGNHQVGCP